MVRKIRCICEICTCGRHHCVHRPKEPKLIRPRCLATEYKDTFKQYAFTPVKPIKPDTSTKFSNQPFDGSTMYQMTFVPLKHEKVVKKERSEYVKPEGTIDYLSSYQRDFEEKYVGKAKSARPEYKPVSSKRPFSGTTVHQETYREWEIPTVESIQPPKGSIRTSTSRFDHKTTFQDDFPGFYGNTSRKMIKPASSSFSIGNGGFEGETTTRSDYTKKNIAPEKSAKPPAKVVMHTDGFDHKTTAQHSFPWPDNFDPAVSCKPIQQAIGSKDSLENNTTHNMTYKEWKVEPTQRIKPRQGWEPSKSRFEYRTTFQHDFSGKKGAPARSLKPEYIRSGPTDAFDDSTTNKMTYRPWSAVPREASKPVTLYQRPKTRFEGQTTFQTDFQGMQSERRDLCVPQENSLHMGGERLFDTSYTTSYHGWRPPSCPARYLHGRQSDNNDFEYSHDTRGHQFFRKPTVEQVEVLSLQG